LLVVSDVRWRLMLQELWRVSMSALVASAVGTLVVVMHGVVHWWGVVHYSGVGMVVALTVSKHTWRVVVVMRGVMVHHHVRGRWRVVVEMVC